MSASAYLDTVMSIWAERRERTSCAIRGDSMAPLIRHGDLLLIEHGSRTLRRGDIVIVKMEGRLVAHRLVHLERTPTGTLLHTMGDRSRQMDPPSTPDQVQGRVVEACGSNGRLRFTSRFWRVSNRLLAAVSCAAADDCRAGSLRGRGRAALRALRSRLLPSRLCLRHAIARTLCATYTKLSADET